MTSFVRLPPEITLLVAEKLLPRDLKSLIITSNTFFALLHGKLQTLHFLNALLRENETVVLEMLEMLGTIAYLDRTILLEEGKSVIHCVVVYGSVLVLKKYLSISGTRDLDLQDVHGDMPLHYAVKYSTAEMVGCLLEHGAGVDAQNNQRQTALQCASYEGSTRIVDMLLEANADIAICANTGVNALYMAGLSGCEPIAWKLLEKGADWRVKNTNGQSLLHLAAVFDMQNLTRTLLWEGADPLECDATGWTPLQLAVKFGRTDIILSCNLIPIIRQSKESAVFC